MIVRLYESSKLDLETVGDMLWQADRQANFHPDSRWIQASGYGTEKHSTNLSKKQGRHYRQFFVRWIGRESVVMWLASNQILFEITSYELLSEEQEALEDNFHDNNQSTSAHIN